MSLLVVKGHAGAMCRGGDLGEIDVDLILQVLPPRSAGSLSSDEKMDRIQR
jgi:hypothetical protein